MNFSTSRFGQWKAICLALGLAALMGLAGCIQAKWGTNAMVSVDIACPSFDKVAAETTAIMSQRGYVPMETVNRQTQSYANAHPRSLGPMLLSFIHGGQDRIEIYAQPTAEGWKLYAMVEPEGYDTYFPRHKMRTILEQVRERCEPAVSSAVTR